HLLAEEVLRRLDENARPVAGLAVGVDRAPVPDGLERGDGERHHVAPRRPVERDDHADPARVALVLGAIEPLRLELAALALIARDLGGRRRFVFFPLHWAATLACACSQACAPSAASRPSRSAQTTSEGPRTMSPAAKTPGRLAA